MKLETSIGREGHRSGLGREKGWEGRQYGRRSPMRGSGKCPEPGIALILLLVTAAAMDPHQLSTLIS